MRRAAELRGEDCGAIRFQASVSTSYYGAHFISIHFQLCDVLNTLSEEHNPVELIPARVPAGGNSSPKPEGGQEFRV